MKTNEQYYVIYKDARYGHRAERVAEMSAEHIIESARWEVDKRGWVDDDHPYISSFGDAVKKLADDGRTFEVFDASDPDRFLQEISEYYPDLNKCAKRLVGIEDEDEDEEE